MCSYRIQNNIAHGQFLGIKGAVNWTSDERIHRCPPSPTYGKKEMLVKFVFLTASVGSRTDDEIVEPPRVGTKS